MDHYCKSKAPCPNQESDGWSDKPVCTLKNCGCEHQDSTAAEDEKRFLHADLYYLNDTN